MYMRKTTQLLLFLLACAYLSRGTYAQQVSVSASGTGTGDLQAIVDNDAGTNWITDSPFPNKYLNKSQQNVLLGDSSILTFTGSVAEPGKMVDGSIYTSQEITPGTNGIAWMEINLQGIPDSLLLLSLDGKVLGSSPIEIWGFTSTTDSIKIGDYNSTVLVKYGLAEKYVKLKLIADASFKVHEVAGVAALPKEYVTLDLGVQRALKSVSTKLSADTSRIKSGKILASIDNQQWTLLFNIDLGERDLVNTALASPVEARYIRAEFEYDTSNVNKVKVFEIQVENAYDPNAGLTEDYTGDASVVYGSSFFSFRGEDFLPGNALDGDLDTRWTTAKPLPVKFVSRPDQNALMNQDLNIITGSSISNKERLLDGNPDNNSVISALPGGQAWVEIDISSFDLFSFYWKPNINDFDTVFVYGIDSTQQLTPIDTCTSEDNGNVRYDDISGYKKIRMEANTSSFRIREFAGLNEFPKETIIFKLGETQPVGQIITRMNVSKKAVSAIHLYSSVDSLTWTKLDDLPREVFRNYTTILPQEEDARYLKFEFVFNLENGVTASFLELQSVHDKEGLYGAKPANTRFSDKSLRELLGLNGTWSWGSQTASDILVANGDTTRGPSLYSPIAFHARDYYSWKRVAADPDVTPDFAALCDSTNTGRNYCKEYNAWKQGGFNSIISSIFMADLDESLFDNPYQAAYSFANGFVNSFGPSNGNDGLVYALEVGNEPWKKTDSTYIDLLYGMIQGAKNANPDFKVIPCALQAYDGKTQLSNPSIAKNYIGYKITERELAEVDIIKTHAYSYKAFSNGDYGTTYPEDPSSNFNQVYSFMRWKNFNAPNHEAYLSEFGFDSKSLDEDCQFDQCVSAKAGSDYLIRAAMKAIGTGFDKLTIFHFANDPNNSSTVYSRSGMTSSRNGDDGGFKKKRVYYAIQQMLLEIGDKKLLSIIAENSSEHIYVFGDTATGNPTHYVGWLPIEGDDTTVKNVTIASGVGVDGAFLLDGAEIPTAVSLPPYSNGELTLSLQSTPTIFRLGSAPASGTRSASTPIQDTMKSRNATLYPNPTDGVLNIGLTGEQDRTISEVSVMDLLGQRQRAVELSSDHSVDVSKLGLKSGLYLLRVMFTDGKSEVYRFILK